MTENSTTPKPMIWSGGEHVFNLNHPWVRSVISIRGLPVSGSTPTACYQRFVNDLYSSEDIDRVIFLGLVGGGLSLKEADDLVGRFVRDRPVLENVKIAFYALRTYFDGGTDVEQEAA
ncbi:gene transfer agent family protein [Tardiphaga sp. vice352]|uniref:GTA-gp10 family protein n=1 Tax=unclassified Tardiphaga TaxID=2631404 RepID=UPI001162E6E9|nr:MULTISPECIES: GTA-gp10 family protein [unclassified Tardiphaga]QDM16743.1 gene transfer agent family protein [Tardiphaga sp. vice278]QDM32018.1 gene transfer agent family protein [Tardiphaga sp. vice352]QDM32704.1 gene transfer agent family protein [Tardiphaga sp. vice352]